MLPPPEKLSRVAEQQISARREYWEHWFAGERERIAAAMAASGTLRTGGFVTRTSEAAERAFFSFAREVMADLLQTLADVYGSTPVELLPWVRDRFQAAVDLMVITLGTAADNSAIRFKVAASPASYHVSVLQTSSSIMRRELEIAIGKIELRSELRQLTPPARGSTFQSDVFISHASEDTKAVAEPIARGLMARGYSVWFDRFALRLGDRLLDKIDEGLAGARFGAVVLSPSFFAKNWPRRELAGLAARQDAEDRKIILPVWHLVSEREIAAHSPTLAAVLGVSTSTGIGAVVEEIAAVIAAEGGAVNPR